MNVRRMLRLSGLAAALVVFLVALVLVWAFRHYLLSPDALYREAQSAPPERAAMLYARLGEVLPRIEEYSRLWAAQASMADIEALRTLRAIVAFRPQSPAAYEAHLAMARYYASIEASIAEDEYRSALALYDTVGTHIELARHLEEQGDYEGAYAEYLEIWGSSRMLSLACGALGRIHWRWPKI